MKLSLRKYTLIGFLVLIVFVFALLYIPSFKASAAELVVNYYSVSYDNYSKGNIEYTFADSKELLESGLAVNPGDPYSDYKLLGYYFDGWYTDEQLETPYAFSEQVESSLNLYAALREVTGVDFGQTSVNLTPETQTTVKGITVYVNDSTANITSEVLELKKAGSIAFSIAKTQNVTFTFENGGTREFVFGIDAVTDNKYTVENYNQFTQVLKTVKIGKGTVTFYDLPAGRYKLVYNETSTWKVNRIELSTPVYKTVRFVDYKRPAIPEQTVAVGDVAIEPEKADVKGYTFIGWYTSAEEPYDFAQAVTDNLTLTAKYQVNTYTVTFAEEGYDSISGTYGSALEEPPQPKREGYVFAGWYQNEELTVPFDFKTDTLQDNMTLYAAFREAGADSSTWLDSAFADIGLPGLPVFIEIFIIVIIIAVVIKLIRGK